MESQPPSDPMDVSEHVSDKSSAMTITPPPELPYFDWTNFVDWKQTITSVLSVQGHTKSFRYRQLAPSCPVPYNSLLCTHIGNEYVLCTIGFSSKFRSDHPYVATSPRKEALMAGHGFGCEFFTRCSVDDFNIAAKLLHNYSDSVARLGDMLTTGTLSRAGTSCLINSAIDKDHTDIALLGRKFFRPTATGYLARILLTTCDTSVYGVPGLIVNGSQTIRTINVQLLTAAEADVCATPNGVRTIAKKLFDIGKFGYICPSRRDTVDTSCTKAPRR